MTSSAWEKILKRIPESKWTWFGNAGHFICSSWCKFHLTTQVGRFLVSTVGEYVPLYKAQTEQMERAFLSKNPFGEEIGYGRLYETMVFETSGVCEAKGCACGLPMIIPSEIKFDGYNNRKDANFGHLVLCQWAASNQNWKRDDDPDLS